MRAWVNLVAVPILLGGSSAKALHGVPASLTPTITFGAETLAGYGGYNVGTSVTLIQLTGALGASADFTIDAAGDLVPAGSYGAAVTFHGPYTAILSNGLVANLSIAANTSTVKSHYGFTINPDTASNFQLATVLGSAANIHLGDNVVMRGGTSPGSSTTPAPTATPALNPLNLVASASRYLLVPPETSSGVTYTQGLGPNGGRIRIQCEIANTAIDANGNSVEGGNCDVGGLTVNSTYDVSIPYDFYNIHFYNNYIDNYVTTGGGPQSFMLGYKNYGYGVSTYYSRFEYGTNIPLGYTRSFVLTALSMRLGTADHDHFVAGSNGIVGTSPSPGGVVDVTTPWYITNSTFEGMATDAIDYGNNSSGATATSNFFFNFNTGQQNPTAGDEFIIGPTTYLFVGPNQLPAAYVFGSPRQVPISPNPDQTMANAICTIMAGGTMAGGASCVAGVNFPVGAPQDPNVSSAYEAYNGPIFDAVIAFSTAVNLTTYNLTAGYARASSTEWGSSTSGETAAQLTAASNVATLTLNSEHSDTFQWVHSNLGMQLLIHNGPTDYNISIRGNELPNVGYRQFYFANIADFCCMVGQGSNGVEVKNNVTSLAAANQVDLWRFNKPNVLSNTFMADVNSTAYAPSDPSYDMLVSNPNGAGPGWNGEMSRASIYSLQDGGGGGTFVNNLANSFSAGVQTTLGSVPSYSFTGSTTASSASVTVTGGVAPVVPTPLLASVATAATYVSAVNGNTITLSSKATATNGAVTFTTVDPFNGEPAGPLTVTNNESVNWSGQTALVPHDGTTMAQVYATFLPHYPLTGGVLATNRAAAIRVFTPLAGSTFVGTTSTSPYTITVTAGAVPPVNIPVNGPDIPGGDYVVSENGNVLTLLFAPTAAGSGITFGTGAMNPDGTYNGALFPNGCWNDNSVYNAATVCAAAN